MILYVLLVLLLLLYLKKLVLCLLYIMGVVYAYYQTHNDKKYLKLCAAPFWLVERFLCEGGMRFLIYQLSTVPSNHMRRLLLKGLGCHIAPAVVIHFKVEIRCPWRLHIGHGSIIGDNAILDARSGLTIGNNVNLSSNVSIYTLQHDYRDPWFRTPSLQEKDMSVKIGDRAWLGANVIVLPGVTIGEGAVCCAGCVVTKDVEPYDVVAGIPAKKVSVRPKDLRYEFTGKSSRIY